MILANVWLELDFSWPRLPLSFVVLIVLIVPRWQVIPAVLRWAAHIKLLLLLMRHVVERRPRTAILRVVILLFVFR